MVCVANRFAIWTANLPTASEPRIEDIPRIAFVTRRFHELQGLTTAMLGGSLIVASLTAHAMPVGYQAPLLRPRIL